MTRKEVAFMFALMVPMQAESFPCFFTVVKDSCWTKYNVEVNLIVSSTAKTLTTVNVVDGQIWGRQAFACQPGDIYSFSASFTPVFWQSDKNKKYKSLTHYQLPVSVSQGDTAWNVTLCYPRDFSEVPYPPEASGDCVCDTSKVAPAYASK
jgi:hypothetical protein